MSWRDSFPVKDRITVTLSVTALLLSIVTWRTGVASNRRVGVGSQMQLYLGQSIATLEAEPRAFEQCGYGRATPAGQERARIVTGLLVNLVEAMDAAGDRRAATWRRRLAELKGPLYDPAWDPAVYASTDAMAREIAALRRGHLGQVDCTSSG